MKEFYIQFMAGVSAETAARLFDCWMLLSRENMTGCA